MILADTSIWVDYLRTGRDGPARALDGHLAAQDVVMCGPVLAELLAGAGPAQRSDLWSLLRSLPWADLRRPDWRSVGEVAADLRSNGKSVPITDIAIAVAAVAADAAVWTRDDDFRLIREVFPRLDLVET